REQRAVRDLPLERRDVRLQLAAPHELGAAGDPIDVAVRVIDASGRPVAATTSIVAMPLAPGRGWDYPYVGYIGNGINWNGGWTGWNGNWIDASASAATSRLTFRSCRYTQLGCRSWQRPRPALRPGSDPGTIAAVATVERGVARLVLDDPGAYKLHAVARL